MDLRRRIADREGELLLFAVTPPLLSTPPERVQEIADLTIARLQATQADGLVLYDIDDEAQRTTEERPFPFLPTMDPAAFLADNLGAVGVPTIVYRAVGKYDQADLSDYLSGQDPQQVLSVFVGASSADAQPTTTLKQAQDLRAAISPDLLVGGVAIPERHMVRGDEHLRLITKQEMGSSFFVTQIVYDVSATKDLVSDYRYECAARGIGPVPIVFTLSVCGSLKTLEFLQWLGVKVPRWIKNELRYAGDPLDASFQQAVRAGTELMNFCRQLGVPFGLNIESVSIRKVEIEASVRLAARLGSELDR
jgi:hypothetical protein